MVESDQQPPFVLGDGAVVALAAAAVAGAWTGGGPGRVADVLAGVLAGAALVAVALLVRRPWLLCLGVAVLAAGLADRALAGLEPATPGPVSGWLTLVTDPVPLDGGGVRVEARFDGRRYEATAFGRAAGLLERRLAGEQVQVGGRRRPPSAHASWLVPRRIVGRIAIEEVQGWRPGGVPSRLANGLRRTLATGAGELDRSSRSLLAGVVLGDDREQPPEVVDDFRAAGLSHLLAVSGQNLSFVLALAAPLLTRLRWSARVPVTFALLAGFGLLVRFEPSVLRAAAMAAVATLAAALGRPTVGLRVLAVAVTALVLVDPLLVRSVGFGLSVSASAAILLLAPRLRPALPGPAWFAEPLAVTLAAQVGTTPLLLATFGEVPFAAVPANLLAVPAAAPLMAWGLTAGLVAGLVPAGIRLVLHLPTAALTWWLAGVARWAAALPVGQLRLRTALILLGAVAVAGLHHRRGGRHPARVLTVATIGVVLAGAVARPAPGPGPAPVTDGVVLWSGPDGERVLLLDGPPNVRQALAGLRASGLRCVDVVAVEGGGAASAALAGAVLRRCPGAAAVAVEGRAHPGWTALAPGTSARLGGLLVAVTDDGDLQVGSLPDAAAARAPPR